MRSTRGSTVWPTAALAPLTPTLPSSTSASDFLRDATPASASALWMRTRSLIQPHCRFRVERRQIVERCQPEALQEIEGRAVEDRPAGGLGATLLHDQAAVQQAADDIVRVDAADPLDHAPGDRLAISHDCQRL